MSMLSRDSAQQRPRLIALCIISGVIVVSGILVLIFVPEPWQLVVLGVGILAGFALTLRRKLMHRSEARPSTGGGPATRQLTIADEDDEGDDDNFDIEEGDVIIIPPEPDQAPRYAIYDDGTTAADERPGRNKRFNHLKTDENGTVWLCVAHYTPTSNGFLKKKTWNRKEHRLKLDNNMYVNKKLAKRIDFGPTDAENAVHWLRLENWWSHGPSQIGIMSSLIAIISVLVYLDVRIDGNYTMVYVAIGVALSLAAVVWYFIIWIKWRCKFQMITNRRVFQLYQPPFNLPDQNNILGLEKLTGGINQDSSFWGRMAHYGTVTSETSADKTDQWIKDGMDFTSNPKDCVAIMSQAKETLETQIFGAQ